MPPAARVIDPTGHPGIITGPGRAQRPDRRPAGRGARRHARLRVSAAGRPASADADRQGERDGADRRPAGGAAGRPLRLRRADRRRACRPC